MMNSHDEQLRVATPLQTQRATLPTSDATGSATPNATGNLKAMASAALRRLATQPTAQPERNHTQKQAQLDAQHSSELRVARPIATQPATTPLNNTDNAIIRGWLQAIEATRDESREVLERCANNPEARAYYLKRADEIRAHPGLEERRQIVIDRLRAHPTIERAFEVIQQGREFRMAVAIRGKGTVELSIPADRWDPQAFLELMETGA